MFTPRHSIRSLCNTLYFCTIFLALSAVSSYAQSACPNAERFEREKELLELNCDYRLNVVLTLMGQLPEVKAEVVRPDITTRQSRVYANEVRVINNRIRSAQRTANIACRAVELRQGTIDRALSTCEINQPVN